MREGYKGFSNETRQLIKTKYNNLCAYCHQPHPLEVHHNIPQSKGGSNEIENGIPLSSKEEGYICHLIFDRLALIHGISFTEVMREGQEYIIGIRTEHLPRYLKTKTPRKKSARRTF